MATTQPRQIEQDVLQLVGGNFTPDALGPAYDAILARARAAPDAYLDAFERLFLRTPIDPKVHSGLHLPGLLRLLADRAPERVRALAGQLLSQYDAATRITDDASERAAVLEALPPETSRFVQRLDRRRDELRAILGQGGTAPGRRR